MRTKSRPLIIAVLMAASAMLQAGSSALAQDETEGGVDLKSCMIEYLDLRETPMGEALRLLSDVSGYNIVPTKEALEAEVSTFLQNVTLDDALKTLCKCYNLWYKAEEDSNVVRVMTISEYQKSLVVYREEKTQVFTLLYPNANSVGRAIRDLYGKRVLLTQDWDQIYQERYELESRLNRLDLLEERGQFNPRSQYGRGGIYGRGLGTGFGGYGGYGGLYGGGYGGMFGQGMYGMGGFQTQQQGPEFEPVEAETRLREEVQKLTIEDTAAIERMKQISELLQSDIELASEDRRALSAEATDLLRTLTDKEAPIYVTVVMRNNQIVVRTGDEEALSAIEELVTRMDVPTPQVLLDVRVLAVNLRDQFESVFDFTYSTKDPGGSNPRNVFVGGGDPAGPPSLVTGEGGFIYQFLDSKLNFRLQMLEDENRVTAMATPILMAANNEVSKVFIGEERPIVVDIDTDTITNSLGNTVTTVDPVTETRNVGTTLLITPNINSDRSVSLRILQENSDISENKAVIPVSTDAGGVEEFEVDVVETQNVIGTVVAKDNLTIAIGGLIEETIVNTESGVPILKDIPILNIFFANITQLRQRQELVVLIRPFVVMTPEEAEEASRSRLEALSIHPYRYGKKDSLETFKPEDVPGLVKPGPSWARALKLHQIGLMGEDPADFFKQVDIEPAEEESMELTEPEESTIVLQNT